MSKRVILTTTSSVQSTSPKDDSNINVLDDTTSSPSVLPPTAAESDSMLDSQESSMETSLVVQWERRKSQFFKFLDSTDVDEKKKEESNDKGISTCHVCNISLRLLRRRHHCRNCRLPVCSVHSQNEVPLPHLGIMKEVRVCDICTRQLVRRRAGYRSPRTSDVDKGKCRTRTRGSTEDEGLASEPLQLLPAPELQPLDSRSGVLYSCLLEEQANIMDGILYVGTLTMGGRALASRRMNANVAIWKDRWLMLTSAEMLTFKATPGAADEDNTINGGSVAPLGELRSSVHLTDIIHIEVDDQYPRILTVIRSDGRIFRVRAKTAEQCVELATALKQAQQLIQEAMHKLQRGIRPEDYTISCVTIQHESSLPEYVLVSAPSLEERVQVEMYPSSILRFYVNGPEANGVAQYSCQMILCGLDQEDPWISSKAEPLQTNDVKSLLRVRLRASHECDSHIVAKREQKQIFWSILIGFLSLAIYFHHHQVSFIWEMLCWLMVWMMILTHFHDPLILLITTRRIHRAKSFVVECIEVSSFLKPCRCDQNEITRDLVTNEEIDIRFLEGCNGNMEEAKIRYMETIQWRHNEHIDSILLQPLPQFHIMKMSFLHVIHKKSRHGHLVTYDHIGHLKQMYDTFIHAGITEEEAMRYHFFLQEYLWQVIDTRVYPYGNQIKVYDLKGISMNDVSGDVFAYIKKLAMMIAQYNPERLYQTFIINPPSWFSLIWKIVSPSINVKTRERMHVLRGSKEIIKGLLELIAEENIPMEYGGSCRCHETGCLNHSQEEKDLREYVEQYLNLMKPGDSRIASHLLTLKEKYRVEIEKLAIETNE